MKRKFYKSCVAVLLSMVMIFGGGQIGAVADAGIVPFGPVQPTVPTISVNVVTPSSQMLVGDTMQLSCITNPAGLSVTWTSSNTSVATVNSSGLVTAFQKGVVTIMGECYDSNAKKYVNDLVIINVCEVFNNTEYYIINHVSKRLLARETPTYSTLTNIVAADFYAKDRAIWKTSQQSDGKFYLTSIHYYGNNKYLGVSGNDVKLTTSGFPFTITRVTSGTYAGLYLIKSGSYYVTQNSSNDVYLVNSLSANCYWEFHKDISAIQEGELEGTYYITNCNSGKYITPNTGGLINAAEHIEQWEYDYDKAQAWDFIYAGNGYYKIKNIQEGTYLTSPVSSYSGEKITEEIELSSGTDRQLWSIEEEPNGSYRFRAKNRSSFVMSSKTNNASDGGNIVQYPTSEGNLTQWYLMPWEEFHVTAMMNYGLVTKSVSILLSGSLANSTTWRSIIESSATSWNNSGAGITINILSTGSSNHTVTVEHRAETWFGLTTSWCDDDQAITRSTITLNTNTVTESTGQSVMVHELGHLFSLDDNPPITNQTIMSYSRNRETMIVPQLYDIYNVRNYYD